eukprot:3936438-Rhodomonas_salina.1
MVRPPPYLTTGNWSRAATIQVFINLPWATGASWEGCSKFSKLRGPPPAKLVKLYIYADLLAAHLYFELSPRFPRTKNS